MTPSNHMDGYWRVAGVFRSGNVGLVDLLAIKCLLWFQALQNASRMKMSCLLAVSIAYG